MNKRRTMKKNTRKTKRTRRHTRNKAKIINKQSGGIILLLEHSIISQIPGDYKYDLEAQLPKMSGSAILVVYHEDEGKYIRNDNYIDNVLRLNEALPSFQSQISSRVPRSVDKCKVYIIFTFMPMLGGTIKILHPIICITGTHNTEDAAAREISIFNSTYDFNAIPDRHTGEVCKSNGLKYVYMDDGRIEWSPRDHRDRTLERTRQLYQARLTGQYNYLLFPNTHGRLGHDKIRALGYVGYFEDNEDGGRFKNKLDAVDYFTGDGRHRNYDVFDNNCQHFVSYVLNDLKEEKDKFVPAKGIIDNYLGRIKNKKTMLDLDIMQGGALREWFSKLSATQLMGSVGSSVGSVTGSVAGSSVSSSTASAVPVSSVVGSTVAGAAAGVAVGNRLEEVVRE